MLQEKVSRLEKELRPALFDLARFYQRAGRFQDAMEAARRMEGVSRGPEEKALCYLKMGQIAEGMNDFTAAVDFYSQALRLEPEETEIWYFVNNNLGFSLNQLGRFSEAEGYCRAAIKIDPNLYNAFKNLGVSLEGQGALAEAAANYIQAVKKEAGDPRALNHLQDLLARNPRLLKENPALVKELENCHDAVAFARKLIDRILKDFNS